MTHFSDNFELSRYENSPPKTTTNRIRIKKKQPNLRKFDTNPSIPEPIHEPSIIKVFWQKIVQEKWSPSTRQQATLTVNSKSLYLIGGISRTISQDVHVFNTISNEWSRLSTPAPIEPRFGHCTVSYQNNFLVFGGGTYFNAVHRLRECLNGVRKLNLPVGQWTYLKTSGTFIQSRKGYTSGIIGRHMIVSGGVDEKQHVLHDCSILNLKKLTWSYLEITNSVPLALAYSGFCTVCCQNSNESIYKYKDYSKCFGVFVFGGIDVNKRPKNDLVQILPGTRPVKCVTVETFGKPPCPRFMHTMVFCEAFRCLLVFGGRVDIKEEKEYTCFNDVHVLMLDNFLWTSVCVAGTVPCVRSGHCAEILGNEMFVFGGVSNSYYCSSDMFKLQIGRDEGKKRSQYFKSRLFRHKSIGASTD